LRRRWRRDLSATIILVTIVIEEKVEA